MLQGCFHTKYMYTQPSILSIPDYIYVDSQKKKRKEKDYTYLFNDRMVKVTAPLAGEGNI